MTEVFLQNFKKVVLIDFLTSKGCHNKKKLEINCVSKFLVLGNSNSYMLLAFFPHNIISGRMLYAFSRHLPLFAFSLENRTGI